VPEIVVPASGEKDDADDYWQNGRVYVLGSGG
jgi:hypothetical protein